MFIWNIFIVETSHGIHAYEAAYSSSLNPAGKAINTANSGERARSLDHRISKR